MVTDFKELKVWERAIDIAEEIYRVTDNFPKKEIYSLTDQVRRAAISISSNIAEGSEQGTNKSFVNFLRIAKGSLREVQSQLVLANRIGYLEDEILKKLDEELIELAKMISGFIRCLLDS